jgi:2-polyprenyl-6-hydroxyphenyl methylase/3-demethylubiquinone-9 3-methyltransferase
MRDGARRPRTARAAEVVTFSFGENWLRYLGSVDEARCREARRSLVDLLETDDLTGRAVLDIGCGSGLFSAAAVALGAASVTSVDIDPTCIEACRTLRAQLGSPDRWRIRQASVLDRRAIAELGPADVVYAWGVLHHTGAMWQAIENVASLVNATGVLILAIYNRHWTSRFWLWFKRRYNRGGRVAKTAMIWSLFAARALVRALKGKSPLRVARGMSTYHDAVDWAGALPYEYASADDVATFCGALGLGLSRSVRTGAAGCNQFVFRRNA